jgi:2-polyprenyl-3-methyl-5-hydroxy-6-metoxy-1,4-benzoquinol methylase
MITAMNFWDQHYSAPGYKYGTTPNRFLTEQVHRLAPASEVLLPGDGEGRNSVWLAQQGHRAHAIDSSQVGLEKAQTLAAERRVAIRVSLADLQHWQPEPASVDAVVLVYLHLPEALRATVLRKLATTLRPGGLWLMEAFHPRQLAHTSGGPKDASMLYTPEQLGVDLGGLLQDLILVDERTELDEGPGHQGLAHVTRHVARRLG